MTRSMTLRYRAKSGLRKIYSKVAHDYKIDYIFRLQRRILGQGVALCRVPVAATWDDSSKSVRS